MFKNTLCMLCTLSCMCSLCSQEEEGSSEGEEEEEEEVAMVMGDGEERKGGGGEGNTSQIGMLYVTHTVISQCEK